MFSGGAGNSLFWEIFFMPSAGSESCLWGMGLLGGFSVFPESLLPRGPAALPQEPIFLHISLIFVASRLA